VAVILPEVTLLPEESQGVLPVVSLEVVSPVVLPQVASPQVASRRVASRRVASAAGETLQG
jgi:hypothetical protein